MLDNGRKKGRKPKEKHYNLTFATNLRQLLSEEEKKGITISSIAEEIGVNRQSLAQYRDGNNVPDVEILRRISEYFNVSADYLIGISNVSLINADLRTICNYTGLSEESVMSIVNCKEFGVGIEILDKLIKNDNFMHVLGMIECEAHGDSFFKIDEEIHINPSYSVFVLEKMLMEAISDILFDRNIEIIQAIQKSVLTPFEKRMYDSHFSSLSDVDKQKINIALNDEKYEQKLRKTIQKLLKQDRKKDLYTLKAIKMVNEIAMIEDDDLHQEEGDE